MDAPPTPQPRNPEAAPHSRVIVLTPPGAAAIAVVRLVGPLTGAFLAAHFSRQPVAGHAVHGEMRDTETVIDDPVVVLSDDSSHADVNLHGGAWVVRAFVELARRKGFELLSADSPPLHPLSVDSSSPLEAEVLAHVPLATTELALRVLLAQPRAWRALQERARAGGLGSAEIQRLLGDHALEWLLHRPRVAILGPANAGKSTLANQLFAQERSITADFPGTTRDWVGEIANIDGLAVLLLDTPGLRHTNDTIEAAAIAQARLQIDRADLIVLVLDATRLLEPEQAALVHRYPDAICVINKVDLAPAPAPAPDAAEAIQTVATTGIGIDALRSAITERFGCRAMQTDRPRCWTDRQRSLLCRALEHPSVLDQL